MELKHIDIDNLKLSPLNVRKHGSVDGADLVPSIRSLGVIQPLLVRKNCEGYEIVAGQRRFAACQALAKEAAEEGKGFDPVPCAVLGDGEDATAIEASLAENIARLPMDEVDQYDAFASLVKQGQSIEDVASHFGVTERLVKQRLAIAVLYTPILNAYRREDIEPQTVRLLTMASTKQQKAWFKLFKEGEAPQHWNLKSWLFGGEEISTDNALFDVDTYSGVITSDLFGEERYFADASQFWEYQSKAIAEMIDDYRDEGWSEVVLHDVGEYWSKWERVKASKQDGGAVHITCRSNGEVEVHEGYITQKEAKRRKREKLARETGEDGTATGTDRPELTQPMQNYLALHRYAAVRTELLGHKGIALRLAVAQIIAGSSLWTVQADPQKANTDAIAESLKANKAEDAFAEERAAVRELLGDTDSADDTLVYRKGDWDKSHDVHAIFAKLLTVDDEAVSRILTFVVAETLPSGTAMVEILGKLLCVDMADHWTPDDTSAQSVFFDLLRDKEAINSMLKEVGGKSIAEGNVTATAKVQKQIIKDCLAGTNGRKKKAKQEAGSGAAATGKQEWQPRYMRFPMHSYTKRGGIDAIDQWDRVKKQFKAA